MRDVHAKDLFVICCISNPARYKTRFALYRQFRHHIVEELGLNLVTVECAFGGCDFQVTTSRCDSDSIREEKVNERGVTTIDVRVTNNSWIWLKENLWNIGARQVPHSCRYLLFCDADIRFLNPHIAHETIIALQTHPVVQPFRQCLDLGPKGEVVELHESFFSCINAGMEWNPCGGSSSANKGGVAVAAGDSSKKTGGGPYYATGKALAVAAAAAATTQPKKKTVGNVFHPGYCMAWRRDEFERMGGMLEAGILGAGDHHMCGCLIGKHQFTLPGNVPPSYAAEVKRWQDRAAEVVRGNVGYVEGIIEHYWHGTKAERKYKERWAIIVDNRVDMAADVYRNIYGVLELTGNKPQLREDIVRYLRERNEDSI